MRFFFLFLLLGLIMRPVIAKPVGKASFHAVGEGLAIDIDGEGALIDASVKKAGSTLSGSFVVKLSDFKTGIGLRDEHMRKALEADKFPTATFVLDNLPASDGETSFTGTLDLHGVKKPFSGKAKIKGSSILATGTIKLTDFGITPPEYKLAKVGNDVEVKVELSL